jgi:hypothetical protein
VERSSTLTEKEETEWVETKVMPKISTGATVIAALALAQAISGVLRAFNWFNIGSDFLGQGLLILPVLGVLVYAWGFLVVSIALLYGLFAVGVFTSKSWAPSLGMMVALVNVLLVLSVVIQGESFTHGVFWLIVPSVIVCYLLSGAGREAAKR